jgi:hypothetical protein
MTYHYHSGGDCSFSLFSLRFFALVTLLCSSQLLLNPAHAAAVQCGLDVCATDFTIDFNGMIGVGGGELLYDAQTGVISLNLDPESVSGNGMVVNGNMVMWTMGDNSTISVNTLSGNIDPILSFGIEATTQGTGRTFGITFDLPVAIEGPISASSSVSYSLTSRTEAGAQIAPISGNVVKAWEIDTSVSGLGSLNKGVDVGDTFSFIGGPETRNSSIFTASSQFAGDLAYDLMSVQIGFSLSGESSVGISGFVEQVVVPVPAAIWLFSTGLLGLIVIARRKKSV